MTWAITSINKHSCVLRKKGRLVNLYYNSVRASLCVCSQTPPRVLDRLGGKMHLIPELNLIYISWPLTNGQGHHGDQSHHALYKKNQLCTTYKCDSSFWRSPQAEQLLYNNLLCKMNRLYANQVFSSFMGYSEYFGLDIHFQIFEPW